MSSRVGYGKSGTFEVYSGYGNNTLSYFIGGVSGEYRNLKFLKSTTAELTTWLEANAVKMPITGTWVFNEKLTAAQPPLRTDIAFTSNGTEFTNMNTGGGNLELTKSYYLFYNDTKVNSDSAYTGKWVNSAYRTITFTQPVQYEGNEEFVRWFVDNAVQSGGGVSFKLNDTITMSIKPENVTWTSDRIAKVPSYYCKPYFINNFKIGDKSYTYFGAHKDATIFKSYRQPDGATTYETTAGLTMYLNILPDESFYTYNRLTGQTSIIYPDYPLSVDANTSGIILVFEELPTGSFLTWLNDNATLIPTIK